MMEVKPSNQTSQSLRLETESKAAEATPSGCSVLEFSFHNLVRLELAEVRFTNFYVALLTLKARFKIGAAVETHAMRTGGHSGRHRWRTVVKRRALMPNPHLLTGSQDAVVLRDKDFRVPLKDVVALRFVLQQPSPMWKEFRLDDVTFWRAPDPPNGAALSALHQLASLAPPADYSAAAAVSPGGDEDSSQSSPPKTPAARHPRAEAVSAKLQQLWAMSAHCQAARPLGRVGDYEKDGCYEGSLLAYS